MRGAGSIRPDWPFAIEKHSMPTVCPAGDHSVSSKNRDRLLEGDIAAKFLAAVLTQAKVKKLVSTDHFSVDGTLIEAWASMKSVKPKDGSGELSGGGGAPVRSPRIKSAITRLETTRFSPPRLPKFPAADRHWPSQLSPGKPSFRGRRRKARNLLEKPNLLPETEKAQRYWRKSPQKRPIPSWRRDLRFRRTGWW